MPGDGLRAFLPLKSRNREACRVSTEDRAAVASEYLLALWLEHDAWRGVGTQSDHPMLMSGDVNDVRQIGRRGWQQAPTTGFPGRREHETAEFTGHQSGADLRRRGRKGERRAVVGGVGLHGGRTASGVPVS